eukprot:scaffold84976_cov60-Phaeocystis_antarctica.AAC.2
MYPPLPLLKVGHAGTSGGACLLAAQLRPLQLKQHGVQRLDGAPFCAARPKRDCQRAHNMVHLDVDAREPYGLPRHMQRLLLAGRHVALTSKASGRTRWCVQQHVAGGAGWQIGRQALKALFVLLTATASCFM